MTVSIAARCRRTGMFGMAVASSSPAVAARCAHARAKVGVVATQNVTDPRLGPAGLDLLARGFAAPEVLRQLREIAGSAAEFRQLSVVDAKGRAAAFTGSRALGLNGHLTFDDLAVAGNMLANDQVLGRAAEHFRSVPEQELAERLLGGLQAALNAGGEAGSLHSAGVLVVDVVSWPLVDLRVDWADDPVGKLHDLWGVWRPQMQDYIVRGLNPSTAPSYGVPGDP